MNRQETELEALIEPSADKKPNCNPVNERQEKRDEEDIYDKYEITHYIERSNMRKDSIFLTEQRMENELKEEIPGTANKGKMNHEPNNGKSKSIRMKKGKNKKDDPSLMLDARLAREEKRSSRSDSKKNRDVIAFEDELQSTIANLFENVNKP